MVITKCTGKDAPSCQIQKTGCTLGTSVAVFKPLRRLGSIILR